MLLTNHPKDASILESYPKELYEEDYLNQVNLCIYGPGEKYEEIKTFFYKSNMLLRGEIPQHNDVTCHNILLCRALKTPHWICEVDK